MPKDTCKDHVTPFHTVDVTCERVDGAVAAGTLALVQHTTRLGIVAYH